MTSEATQGPAHDARLRARIQEEALYGRLPVLASEREYDTGGILATGITYAMATWCFLIGGYAANVTGLVAGIVALVGGSLVGVTLSVAAAAMACNRYGLEQIDYVKSSFGQRGAKLVLLLYIANQLGWTGTILVMWGRGVQNTWQSFGWASSEDTVRGVVLIALALAYLVVWRGVHVLNVFNKIVTPGLLVVTALLFYVILRHRSWAEMLVLPPLEPSTDARWGRIVAFEYGLGAGFSWWPGIGFLTRNAISQRVSLWPQLLTLGIGMGVICCVGLMAGLVFRSYDPTVWMVQAGGPALGVMALLLVACANLTAAAIMMFTAALGLRHVRRFQATPWWKLGAFTFSPLLAYVLFPEALYEHGSAFLAYNATAFAPICGILLVDYLALRRQRLNLSQFFEGAPQGHYWFLRGFNPVALGCMLLGQGLYVWLLDPVTLEGQPAAAVWTASAPSVLVSMGLYALLTHIWIIPRGLGGYGATTTPLPLLNPNL
ncbi:MAG TPA: cytosine permease [Myxococcota bacterium]|nr:cytosine permease [Myxococcota bacterium]